MWKNCKDNIVNYSFVFSKLSIVYLCIECNGKHCCIDYDGCSIKY